MELQDRAIRNKSDAHSAQTNDAISDGAKPIEGRSGTFKVVAAWKDARETFITAIAFIGGLGVREIAQVMNTSTRTVER